MKILAQQPDVERAVVDYLTAALAARGNTASVGVVIPTIWNQDSTPFVQVALDGTPTIHYPISAEASVRITAWAYKTTDAKALVSLCEGLLLSAYLGGYSIARVKSLASVLPARDPDTLAQLAFIVVDVTTRFQVLP